MQRTRSFVRGGAAMFAAAIVLSAVLPTAALASTPTTTTLDVPAGTQYGPFMVTAHVRPAPVPTNGFTPAVGIYVDGVMNAAAPLDTSGDASTQLSLPVGSYQIKARFEGFGVWDASESGASTVRVGVPTQVMLSSSLNKPLDSQPVTITATVSPSDITGGNLSTVDAFDGGTIASGALSSGNTSVAVTRTFAAGVHTFTASYAGHGDHGPSRTELTLNVRADTSVDATHVGVTYTLFYPFRDGYRDAVAVRGTLGESARVLIRIYPPSGGPAIETVNLGLNPPGRYQFVWDGRRSSGSILPEGAYRVVQRLTDSSGNVRNDSHSVVLSRKRLVWHKATSTRTGSDYDGIADTGNGTVSASHSAYAGGVRLSSGTAGVAVNYKFPLHSALAYGTSVAFEVLGRSANGKRVLEGLWDPTPCYPSSVSCYDTKSMGPDYAWWSIGGGLRNIGINFPSRGVRAYGAVIVPYTGAIRIFDVSRVRLVYRWADLGN